MPKGAATPPGYAQPRDAPKDLLFAQPDILVCGGLFSALDYYATGDYPTTMKVIFGFVFLAFPVVAIDSLVALDDLIEAGLDEKPAKVIVSLLDQLATKEDLDRLAVKVEGLDDKVEALDDKVVTLDAKMEVLAIGIEGLEEDVDRLWTILLAGFTVLFAGIFVYIPLMLNGAVRIPFRKRSSTAEAVPAHHQMASGK